MPPRKKTKISSTSAKTAKASKPAAGTGSASTSKANGRRSVKAGRRTNAGGHMRGLEDMPFDVMFEILSTLHPRDILNLSRTSKAVREMLMSRTFASAWKAARAQIEGLPDIPPLMSEPEYANLLFFNNCFGCDKYVPQTLFSIRVRYCTSCRTNKDLFWTYNRAQEWLSCIIKSDDVVVEDIVNSASVKLDRSYTQRVFVPAQVCALKEQWLELKNKASKKKFVRDRIEQVKRIREHVEELNVWQEELKQNKGHENDALKKKRVEMIEERLREEGWEEELKSMSEKGRAEFLKIDGVNRPTGLNDRSWGIIRDKVIHYMQGLRTALQRQKYSKIIQTRVGWLKDALRRFRKTRYALNGELRLVGSVLDYAFMPKVQAILDDNSGKTPSRKDIIARLSDVLPALTDEWVGRCKNELTALVAEPLKEAGIKPEGDPLTLAVTALWCKRCCGYPTPNHHWPEVINHSCLRTYYLPNTTAYDRALGDYLRSFSWNDTSSHLLSTLAKSVRVNEFLRYRSEVITACGLNPSTATTADMDICGVRLRCRLCAYLVKQEVFDWAGAMDHDATIHTGYNLKLTEEEIPHWDRIPSEHAAKARELQEAIVAEGDGGYFCKMCGKGRRGDRCYLNPILAHLRSEHAKKDPVDGVDYGLRSSTRLPRITMYSSMLSENEEALAQVKAGQGFFADL